MVSVIIVDDESDLVEILSESFAYEKIDVLATGNNGKDAIELCIKHSPDYLLMDLNMAQYDGFYALENLPKMKSIPKLILITGQDDSQIEQFQNYENVTLIKKPFVLQNIINLILGKT